MTAAARQVRLARGVPAVVRAVAMRGGSSRQMPSVLDNQRRLREADRILDAIVAASVGRRSPALRGWDGRIERERTLLRTDHSAVTWKHGEPMNLGQIVARASGPARLGRLLYAAVSVWHPTRALELGTAVGLSAAYQAAALRDRGGEGDLVTLEGYEALARVARGVWERLSLEAQVRCVVGRFETTLDAVLAEAPVDYAFVDGNHDYRPTMAYVEQIAATAVRPLLLVLDDLNYNGGMHRAWRRLVHDPRTVAARHLGRVGLIVRRPG